MTDYVRALVPREGAYDLSHTTSRVRAETAGWELLEEPTHKNGQIRPDTRANGRPAKPQTTVAQAAADKAAGTNPASTDPNAPKIKEN